MSNGRATLRLILQRDKKRYNEFKHLLSFAANF